MASISVKLIPQPGEWIEEVTNPPGFLTCPVCFIPVQRQNTQGHTKHHEDIANIVQLLQGLRGGR